MARLGVNIDHVATVRQARRTDEPDTNRPLFNAEPLRFTKLKHDFPSDTW